MTQPTPTDSGEERLLMIADAIVRRLFGVSVFPSQHNKRVRDVFEVLSATPPPAVTHPTDSGEERKAFVPRPGSLWLVLVERRHNVIAVCASGKGFYIPGQEPCWHFDHVAEWIQEITPPQPSADEKQETPETDAEEARICKEGGWGVDTDEALTFARSLEKRLRAATARAEAAEKERDQARAEVEEAKKNAGTWWNRLLEMGCTFDREWTNSRAEKAESELATLKARCEGLEVFEVVDCTNEETYWPLGVFLSKEAALSVLDSGEPPYNEDRSDYVKVEVRSRKVGFNPNQYDVIATRRWVHQYEEDADDSKWTARPIEYAARQSAGSGEGKV